MKTRQCIQAIASIPSLDTAGQAVDQLVLAGFPLADIFLVGRDVRFLKLDQPDLVATVPIKELLHQANLKTLTHASSKRRQGMMIGNCTGGVTGFLVGVGLLTIPGVGEALLGGVILYLISLTGLGTVAGGVLGKTIGQKMTERLMNTYLTQILHGNYLLLVSGSEADIARAESILCAQGIRKYIS